MITITCSKELAQTKIADFVKNIPETLYRGLGSLAAQDYQKQGQLLPYDGNLAVGKGVCFSSRLEEALGYSKGTLIITTREKLDPQKQAVDTRLANHDIPARNRLEQKKISFSGYDLWEEIQKEDTILANKPEQSDYIFVKRTAVTQQEIIAEVLII